MKPGPWEPEQDTGYNAHARPWVLVRVNAECLGGRQVMQTAAFQSRRFASQEAAQRVADQRNRSTP